MKRKLAWVLIVVVLVVAVVIVLRPGKPGPRGHIEMTHLGFSNSPAGSEAIFAVHFPPRMGGISWTLVELDRWEEGRWNPWNPAGFKRPGLQFDSPPSPASLANGRRVDLVGHYKLPSTNETWRLRIHIDEGPLRPPRFIQLWRNLVERQNQGPNKYNRWDYSYWITNEVHPAASAR
jgi:hypothetical protein